MESIGEKLRASREEKGLSIDQVARDTNIAKRYILALEEEAFSEFPGEPYLVGFLRNYSDYLGLDAEEIVGLYKNFKIQEQPVPMEELLEPQRRRRPLVFIVIVLVVLLVVAGILFGPSLLSKRSGSTGPPTTKAAVTGGTRYELKDEIVEKRFVAGDIVVVPVGDKSYQVKLSVAGRDLVLTDAAGEQTVKLGQEKSIDLNGDGTPDLKVFLRDVDLRDPTHAIVVRFDRFTQSPQAPAATQAKTAAAQGGSSQGTASRATPTTATPRAAATSGSSAPAVAQTRPSAAPSRAAAGGGGVQGAASAAPAASQPIAPQASGHQQPQAVAPQPAASPAAGRQQPQAPPQPAAAAPEVPIITPQSSSASSGPVVIMQNGTATPFSVNINFAGYCLFRYLIDGHTEDQRYFQKGETTRLEVNQDVEIWASNGGVLNVTVAGNSVDMGNPGEVVARRIGWVKDHDSGSYQLQMIRVQ